MEFLFDVDIHRDQGIVERFNRTLAERLFGHQYAQETRLSEAARSTEWVKRLPAGRSSEWRGHLVDGQKVLGCDKGREGCT